MAAPMYSSPRCGIWLHIPRSGCSIIVGSNVRVHCQNVSKSTKIPNNPSAGHHNPLCQKDTSIHRFITVPAGNSLHETGEFNHLKTSLKNLISNDLQTPNLLHTSSEENRPQVWNRLLLINSSEGNLKKTFTWTTRLTERQRHHRIEPYLMSRYQVIIFIVY